jgi:hypothetical protein
VHGLLGLVERLREQGPELSGRLAGAAAAEPESLLPPCSGWRESRGKTKARIRIRTQNAMTPADDHV